jgi:hypothetical protein
MPAYPVSVDNAYEYWHRRVKLITALRTAVEKGEGTLDKEAASHDDLLDAFPFVCAVLALDIHKTQQN